MVDMFVVAINFCGYKNYVSTGGRTVLLPRWKISTTLSSALVCSILSLFVPCSPGWCGRYTHIVEVPTFARGHGEIIQVASFGYGFGTSEELSVAELQYGIDFGLTDHLQVGFALPALSAAWTPQQGETSLNSAAAWALYNLSDPETALLGVTLAGVVWAETEYLIAEAGLLLEKSLGSWIIDYNVWLNYAAPRRESTLVTRGLLQSLGASYSASARVAVGLEFLHEAAWTHWSQREEAIIYGGPNVALDFGRLWLTVTPLLQLSSLAVQPDFSLQTQLGYPF